MQTWPYGIPPSFLTRVPQQPAGSGLGRPSAFPTTAASITVRSPTAGLSVTTTRSDEPRSVVEIPVVVWPGSRGLWDIVRADSANSHVDSRPDPSDDISTHPHQPFPHPTTPFTNPNNPNPPKISNAARYATHPHLRRAVKAGLCG